MSLHSTFLFLILFFRLASVQKQYYGQLSDSCSLWSTVETVTTAKSEIVPNCVHIDMYIGNM